MPHPTSKLDLIKHELRSHLPFTLMGVMLSLTTIAIYQFIFVRLVDFDQHATFENFFHFSHYMHVFVSAIATTAFYYRQEKHVLKTIMVGFTATLIFCGLSDILLPFIGGSLLGLEVHFHLCLLEEPVGILIVNALGIWIGIVLEVKFGKISYFSHGSHVFVSSLASMLYLVTFGNQPWNEFLFGLFVITTVAVVIPCCSSDIILPVSCVSGVHGHEHEDEHTEHTHD